MTRATVVGAVLGGIAALGAAGVAGVATKQHRDIARLRDRAESTPETYARLPADRAGTVRASDGVELRYEEVGPVDAPVTVVFAHGYTLALESWWYQRRDLAERYGGEVRMVFYDQRSHGRSGRSTSEGCTVQQLGRDLAAVVDARVPHGPLVLAGHSMGGMSVLAFTRQHPELFGAAGRVRGVALIATSAGDLGRVGMGLPGILGRLETPVLSATLRLARWQGNLVERGRRLGKDVAWAFTQWLSFDDKQIDPATTKFVNDMISATRVEVVADFFPAILALDEKAALPVLADTAVEIVAADHDVMLPVPHSRRLAKALPDAHLTVVEHTGHLLMLEKPEPVDDAVARLVDVALHSATKAAS